MKLVARYVLKRDQGSLPERLTRYKSELNEEQFRVVTAPPKATLVVAGAGTGKTRAITYRVAYLIEQGVSPQRILLATFTNRAAREMLRRVESQTGNQNVHRIWGGTFHRIANMMLRRRDLRCRAFGALHRRARATASLHADRQSDLARARCGA